MSNKNPCPRDADRGRGLACHVAAVSQVAERETANCCCLASDQAAVQWEQWERDRKIKVFESKRMRAREVRDRELAEMEKGGRYVN